MENNRIKLAGLISAIEYSHTSHNEDFYTGLLSTRRASGVEDIIKLIIPKCFAEKMESGNEYMVIGNVRTRNEFIGENKTHLELYVFVNELHEYEGFDYNDVELDGYICRKPDLRETPLGRKITDMLFAVNRKTGRTDYIPVISWGRSAEIINDFPVGTHLLIAGRLQSREYQKKINETEFETRVAYEVSTYCYGVIKDEKVSE